MSSASIRLGATAGVILGGGLGCFGVVTQAVLEWKRKRDG